MLKLRKTTKSQIFLRNYLVCNLSNFFNKKCNKVCCVLVKDKEHYKPHGIHYYGEIKQENMTVRMKKQCITVFTTRTDME